MKNSNPQPLQIPRLAPATAMGSETLPLMKTKLTILKLVFILCGIFATTAVFGQTTYTWTGVADGTNIAVAGNWTTNGSTPAVTVPTGASGDIAQWIGVTASNLVIWHGNPALPGTGFGTSGINLLFTASQVNSVQFVSPSSAAPVVGINNMTIDSGAAPVSFGDGSANLFNIIGRPASALHDWINNSANPVIIYPNVRWQAGGGAAYTLIFDGTGNWTVTNNLTCANNVAVNVAKLGSGTLLWAGPSIPAAVGNNVINSPVTFNEGTVILASSGLLANQAIQNNGATPTLLVYDATAQSQTLGGAISGPMSVKVSNGTLTLSGQSTFTGNVELNNGEAIVNTTENAGTSGPLGNGGTISFTGGTLGWSVNNVFDYSSRFNTAASQAYRFDSGGQSVTLATGLTSSGGTLTKVGPGTLTLNGANTYSGTTTVSAGKLVFGNTTGSGNIAVADGAALGVVDIGTQVTPGTLTLGTSSGATLEFNNVNSTTTAPLAAGTISSVGTVTININTGTFTVGQSYPLLTWTTGSAPTVSLGTLNGYIGTLSFTGNTLKLNITATAYKYTGANNGNWDLATANNWVQNGGAVVYGVNGAGPALFDDTAAGNFSVTVNSAVSATLLVVNNTTNAYSIASSGANNIGGSTALTKSGANTLTLSGGANAYTGVTTVSGGTLSVGALANGGSASDIGAANNNGTNLVLNGGTLHYIGGSASIDRLFALGTGGGTIDASGVGELVLNNAGPVRYSGPGARVLILTGTAATNNTIAGALADNGGATTVTKSGAGTWILSGTNSYSGGTTIAAGTLQVGAGGATGSLGSGNIVDNGSLIFNRTGTLTVNGVISGNGPVTVQAGTVVLAANNTYQNVTTISNGSTLQIGNGGATGSLYQSQSVSNNGLLIYNSTGSFSQGGGGFPISGTGNLIKRGSGTLKIIGPNDYTGWTLIEAGATLQVCEGNQGRLDSSVVTNNGTLKFVRQDWATFFYTNNIVGSGNVVKDVNNANHGDVTLTGNNTYTNGTIIAGGGICIGDGTNAAGSILGNVWFTNSTVSDDAKYLQFNRPDNVTITNFISGSGSTVNGNKGQLIQNGTGVLTLTANNTYAGITTVSNGTLQVGAGGTTGAIGTNNVNNFGVLVFNRSDSLTFGGGISGPGSVVKSGAGTLTLTGVPTLVDTNTLAITGTITVSNGTLVLDPTGGSVGASLNVRGGTLVPGAVGAVSTLTVSNNMNITAGTVSVTLNKSLSPSNSLFSVVGTISATGGTLNVRNYGPALVPGDKFTVFSQPVTGGAAMTVSGANATWVNNLAVDGSVTVSTVLPPAPLSYTHTGNNLQFSWNSSLYSVKLQSQTNSASVGISNNWADYPGGGTSPVTVPIDVKKGTVYFRLVSTP
jgi:fibronectin-binding autotransporter adhesin